jgi:hypothetical protein
MFFQKILNYFKHRFNYTIVRINISPIVGKRIQLFTFESS